MIPSLHRRLEIGGPDDVEPEDTDHRRAAGGKANGRGEVPPVGFRMEELEARVAPSNGWALDSNWGNSSGWALGGLGTGGTF
jgi:hypothetical protein